MTVGIYFPWSSMSALLVIVMFERVPGHLLSFFPEAWPTLEAVTTSNYIMAQWQLCSGSGLWDLRFNFNNGRSGTNFLSKGYAFHVGWSDHSNSLGIVLVLALKTTCFGQIFSSGQIGMGSCPNSTDIYWKEKLPWARPWKTYWEPNENKTDKVPSVCHGASLQVGKTDLKQGNK